MCFLIVFGKAVVNGTISIGYVISICTFSFKIVLIITL